MILAMTENSKKTSKILSTEPYKGVRDFYPEDWAAQEYIFSIWRKAVERFGFNAYNTSILEPSDLYKAKSGDEMVNEQTYTFLDRGEREVTLRPEMTPSVARLIAAKKRELGFSSPMVQHTKLFPIRTTTARTCARVLATQC
jgi:histidyl-tRNA synthetase